MDVTQDQIDAGQAVYTRRTLAVYDFVVLGVSNRFIWRCPTPRLVAHYNQHVSANHLDVGVGTGYFLDRCRFPTAKPRIALMDLNQNALAHASKRIARYHPDTFHHNALEPLPTETPKFDSVGINYVLHCLPGTMATKAALFDHLAAAINPGGVLFGSTLLSGGVANSFLATRLMRAYNRRGIFSNHHDDLAGLEHALRQRFGRTTIEVHGSAALFSARI